MGHYIQRTWTGSTTWTENLTWVKAVSSSFPLPQKAHVSWTPVYPSTRHRWLQLARLVAARASDRGTRQQMLSTFYSYKPSSFRAYVSIFPNIFHRSQRNRHNSLPYAASLYHHSDTISQKWHPLAHVACSIKCIDLADRSMIKM